MVHTTRHLRSNEVDYDVTPVMKELLLMTRSGEHDMIKDLAFLTQIDLYTKKRIWQVGTKEYTLNPFGKLKKKLSKHLPNGKVFSHASYYHGFFISLLCTEDFYNKYSEILKTYDVTDESHYNRQYMPKWF
jgi:hypothetical protein|tara:strand:+ start:707 stop:1099 length:393 start_codon:yes stop_codon:yes gene_type:complete